MWSLALDISTRTGWAFWKPGLPKPRHGVFEVPKPKRLTMMGVQADEIYTDYRSTSGAFYRHFEAFCKLEGVQRIVFEAPILINHGGRNQTGIQVAQVQFGLVMLTWLLADQLGIACNGERHGTMMKHWVGHGGLRRDEGKLQSVERVKRLGWKSVDDNDADALGLLFLHLHTIGADTPFDTSPAKGPLFNGA